MGFLWSSQQRAMVSLKRINKLIFLMKMQCIFCEVEAVDFILVFIEIHASKY